MRRAGCDYTSSIHLFLRPGPGKRDKLFSEVWLLLMPGVEQVRLNASSSIVQF